jgi:chromosome segregation ATPase
MGKEVGSVAELRQREDLDNDMNKVNKELGAIVEEQHQRRLALLKANEDVTREIVDVEVEIRRLENLIEQGSRQFASLSDQRVELEGNHRRLKRDVEDLSREDGALNDENKTLSSERSALDEEVTRLKKLKADYLSALSKFTGGKKE